MKLKNKVHSKWLSIYLVCFTFITLIIFFLIINHTNPGIIGFILFLILFVCGFIQSSIYLLDNLLSLNIKSTIVIQKTSSRLRAGWEYFLITDKNDKLNVDKEIWDIINVGSQITIANYKLTKIPKYIIK